VSLGVSGGGGKAEQGGWLAAVGGLGGRLRGVGWGVEWDCGRWCVPALGLGCGCRTANLLQHRSGLVQSITVDF